MKRKILIPIFFILLIQIRSRSWPLHLSTPITVVVTDADTGLPIPGVLVSIFWEKIPIIGIEERHRDIKKIILLSDSQGKITTPYFLSFHFLSYFEDVSVGVSHPYYFGNSITVKKNGKTMDIDFSTKSMVINSDSEIDIKLVGLSSAYKNFNCQEINREEVQGDVSGVNLPKNLFAYMSEKYKSYFENLPNVNPNSSDPKLILSEIEVRHAYSDLYRKKYCKEPPEFSKEKNKL